MKKRIIKKTTLIFTMNLLTNNIIFLKTGLLLGVILFFLGCKKEQNKIGIDDPNKLATNTYFIDTLTVKTEVILVNDSINTTNASTDDLNSILMAGAYSDPILGPIAMESFTRLSLATENIELPAATATTAHLSLNYSYYYGDTLQSQTINAYKLIDFVGATTTYSSTSPALNYNPTPIGSITFNAASGSSKVITIEITDIAYLQSILDASKNKTSFETEIPGIALIPANNTSGSIIKIDGSSSILRVFYNQYTTTNNTYDLTLGKSSRKFYRVVADRSASSLSSLNNNYDSISTSLTNNQAYIQACTGIRTRVSFPYLQKLRDQFPNMAIISGQLVISGAIGSSFEKYTPNSGLFLFRTEFDNINTYKIKKDSKGAYFHVQLDDKSQIVNTEVPVIPLVSPNTYTFYIRSYLQAIWLDQIKNEPLIISPRYLFTDANRLVFNDFKNSSNPIKLNLYFTSIK